MIKKKQVFFLLIFMAFQAGCFADPLKLTFNDLKKSKAKSGDLVEIRGFVYNNTHETVLSSEPHVKSCCIGSHEKRVHQILLLGSIASDRHLPVTIRGVLRINEKSRNSPWAFSIENAQLVESTNTSPFWAAAAVFSVAAAFVIPKRFLGRMRYKG